MNVSSKWVRLDSLPPSNRTKRSSDSTSWAANWSHNNSYNPALKKPEEVSVSPLNRLYSAQRDFAHQQFLGVLESINQTGRKDGPFIATNVRLMVNVGGCGYTVDCSEFNQTVGVIGSLVPCHLSSRNGHSIGVIDHQPELDQFIILYLFTLPLSLFCGSVLLLCLVHHYSKCCCCLNGGNSTAEFSAALLVIKSGQLGTQLPRARSQTSTH